jgi:hypothetical protein
MTLRKIHTCALKFTLAAYMGYGNDFLIGGGFGVT